MTLHATCAAEVARKLDTDPRHGLRAREAAARLARYGPNELEGGEEVRPARILVEQLRSPMILLLAGAGLLSAALGDSAEAVVIFVVVVLNAWIGFRQEYRAERAMASLQAMTVPPVRVLRGGATGEHPARELVRGDDRSPTTRSAQNIKRLMTVPGVNVICAATFMAGSSGAGAADRAVQQGGRGQTGRLGGCLGARSSPIRL